ncbi:MAG: hypothetical protein HY686_07775 [Chloroflexi bacterium]|nr:hypothetical protein [Chloroflexota bacterium]
MTMKETITGELLDAVEDPAGLEALFHRHARSKGPLYSALGEATAKLRHRLEKARDDTAEAEARRKRLQEQVDSLEEQRRNLDGKVQDMDRRVTQAEGRLAEVQGLLDRAQELAGQGFGEGEFARLAELLAQVAASEGAPPEDVERGLPAGGAGAARGAGDMGEGGCEPQSHRASAVFPVLADLFLFLGRLAAG